MSTTAVCKPLSTLELVKNFPTYYPGNVKELEEFSKSNDRTFEKLNSHTISESDEILESLNSQTILYQASKSTLITNKSIISNVQSQVKDQSKEEEFFSKERYKILQKEKTKVESELAQLEQELTIFQNSLSVEQYQQDSLSQQISQKYADSFESIDLRISQKKQEIDTINSQISQSQNQISNLYSTIPSQYHYIIIQTLQYIKNKSFSNALQSFNQSYYSSYCNDYSTIIGDLNYLISVKRSRYYTFFIKTKSISKTQFIIILNILKYQNRCGIDDRLRPLGEDLICGRNIDQALRKNETFLFIFSNYSKVDILDVAHVVQSTYLQFKGSVMLYIVTVTGRDIKMISLAYKHLGTLSNQSRIDQIISKKNSINNQVIQKKDALNKTNQQLQQWEKDNLLRTQNKLNNQLLNQIKVNIGEMQELFDISINELSSDMAADIDLMQLLHDSVKEEFENKLIMYK